MELPIIIIVLSNFGDKYQTLFSHNQCGTFRRWSSFIYTYIYMCVCVCVCVLKYFVYNINKINTKKKVCSKIQNNRIMNLWRNNIIITISEQRLKCVERKISLVGIMSVREKRHWSFRMVNVMGLEEEKDGGIS